MLYDIGDKQHTQKYPNQLLKIVCTGLVMLVVLMCGFYMGSAKNI